MDRKTMCAASLAAVVLGCTTSQPPPPPAQRIATTASITTLTCTGVKKACPDQTKPCQVTVNLTSSTTATVDPGTLKIAPGSPVTVRWDLDGPGGDKPYFDVARGDGVFFKNDPQDQFEDNYATPTPVPASAPSARKRGKHYWWTFLNTRRSDYPYMIQFRTSTQVFQCDPTINNDPND